MKRCITFLLLSIALAFAAVKPGFAYPLLYPVVAAVETNGPIETGDKKADRQRSKQNRGEKSLRKGVGAGFWGGPYWGYGPRWGHRCETCKSTCESDSGSSRCKRCRVRCGW